MSFGEMFRVVPTAAKEQELAKAVFLVAIPFAWIAVTFTVKRLRDAGQPLWLAALTLDRQFQGTDSGLEPGKHFAFGVSEEPVLMKETSPWGDIKLRHLEDHDFQPERVDFVITPLPDGDSRLEGTTTYQNKMWSGAYWRLWTDGLIHSIHRHVFEHIKQMAEADVRESARR